MFIMLVSDVSSFTGFITSEEAKKKWNSLSDTYRKNKKESEMPSGSGARKKIKWIHMDRMEFLGDVCLQSKYVYIAHNTNN